MTFIDLDLFAWSLTLSLKCDLCQTQVGTLYSSEATRMRRRKCDVTQGAVFKEVHMDATHASTCDFEVVV